MIRQVHYPRNSDALLQEVNSEQAYFPRYSTAQLSASIYQSFANSRLLVHQRSERTLSFLKKQPNTIKNISISQKNRCIFISVLNPSHHNPGRREKIKLNFYFQTSLWCLKRFYKGSKDHHETFWGTTKKYANKNLIISIQLLEMHGTRRVNFAMVLWLFPFASRISLPTEKVFFLSWDCNFQNNSIFSGKSTS